MKAAFNHRSKLTHVLSACAAYNAKKQVFASKPKSSIHEPITFSIEKTNIDQTILGRLAEPSEIEKKEDFQDAMEDIYKTAGEYIRKLME